MKNYIIKQFVCMSLTMVFMFCHIYLPDTYFFKELSIFAAFLSMWCLLFIHYPEEFYRSENNTKIAEAILEQLRNNVNDFTARKSPNNMSDSIVNTKGTVEINIEDLRVLCPVSIYFSPEEKTEIREIIKTILDNDTNKIIESL